MAAQARTAFDDLLAGVPNARPRLYVLPSSYPCVAVEWALRAKRIDYERVTLQFGVSMVSQQARFGRRTVPGLALGNERVTGSRLIMRALEGLEPRPSLYPDDRAERRMHDDVERWGELVFQDATRWIFAHAVLNTDPGLILGYVDGGLRVTPPAKLIASLGRAEMNVLGWSVERVLGEIEALPSYIDAIGAWYQAGLLGSSERPTAAGLQILSSVRFLLTMEDIAPLIAAAGLEQPTRALFPNFTGQGRLPAGSLRLLDPITNDRNHP